MAFDGVAMADGALARMVLPFTPQCHQLHFQLARGRSGRCPMSFPQTISLNVFRKSCEETWREFRVLIPDGPLQPTEVSHKNRKELCTGSVLLRSRCLQAPLGRTS